MLLLLLLSLLTHALSSFLGLLLLQFHYAETGVMSHPIWSSVFYLTGSTSPPAAPSALSAQGEQRLLQQGERV